MVLRCILFAAFWFSLLFGIVLALVLLVLWGLVSIGYFFYLHRLALAVFSLASQALESSEPPRGQPVGRPSAAEDDLIMS